MDSTAEEKISQSGGTQNRSGLSEGKDTEGFFHSRRWLRIDERIKRMRMPQSVEHACGRDERRHSTDCAGGRGCLHGMGESLEGVGMWMEMSVCKIQVPHRYAVQKKYQVPEKSQKARKIERVKKMISAACYIYQKVTRDN